jgi:hypothetical protein
MRQARAWLRFSRFQLVAVLLLASPGTSLASFPGDAKGTQFQVMSWREGVPECSFSQSADGVYHYASSYETLTVTLAVSPRELEKTRRTLEHVFEVILTFRNRGTIPIEVSPDPITLELVDHYHMKLPSLDPDAFSARIQDDADELAHQSERDLKKHPERKPEIETRLQEHQKVVAQWLDYLSTKALRKVTLTASQPEATGLVVFNTRSRWKGNWKEKENLVLRVRVEKTVFEFPFALPPEAPKLQMRPQN